MATEHAYGAIVLDVMLPGMNGYAVDVQAGSARTGQRRHSSTSPCSTVAR